MNLYQKIPSEGMVLPDVNGRALLAETVFSKSILALNIKFSEEMKGEASLKDEDVRWVITVPAIWSETAKQFMRKCANVAGITDNHLIIALEPEAASIYCQYVKTKGNDDTFKVSKPGTQYMVVDLGVKCGSNDYNPIRQTCCNGVVSTPAGWSCCSAQAYNPELSVCCQGVVHSKNGSSCCKDQAYYPILETCCIDALYPVKDGHCCGNNIYDPTTEKCCEGSINQNVEPEYKCCADKAYSPASETCCFGKLFTPEGLGCCGDQTYIPQDETCCNGTVTEPSGLSCCGKLSYDPADQTCCNGAVKETNFVCFGNTQEIISKYFVK